MRVTRRLRGQDPAPERPAEPIWRAPAMESPEPRLDARAEPRAEVRVEPRPAARPIAGGNEEMFEIPSFLRRQNS